MGEFMIKHPDVIPAHDQAVFDAYTSQHAESQGLTNSDFLRMRQHMRSGLHDYSEEYLDEMFDKNIEQIKVVVEWYNKNGMANEMRDTKTEFSEKERRKFINTLKKK
jgi:hypothetical protein